MKGPRTKRPHPSPLPPGEGWGEGASGDQGHGVRTSIRDGRDGASDTCCQPSSTLHPGLVRNRASIDNVCWRNRQQQAPANNRPMRAVGFIRNSGGSPATRNCSILLFDEELHREDRGHRHRLRRPGHRHLPRRERQRRHLHRQGRGQDRRCSSRGRSRSTSRACASWCSATAATAGCAFTTDLAEAIAQAELVFIAVGTPQGADGAADLTGVWAVGRRDRRAPRRAQDRRHQEHRPGRHQRRAGASGWPR